MAISVSALAERAMSSFPLSIGTALAFESLFKGNQPVYDPERIVPEHIDIGEYTQLWVNLSTLYRNLIGSIPTSESKIVMPGDLYDAMVSEVEVIREIVKQGSDDLTKVFFYKTEFSNMKIHHPHANLREDTTIKQQEVTQLRNLVLKEFMKTHGSNPDVIKCERKLPGSKSEKVLILTHDAYDLLSHNEFSRLDLLESHTGVRKNYAAWNTKFTISAKTNPTIVRIPFNLCFLQVFGDSVHFHPFSKQACQAIFKLAEEMDWNPTTTPNRIRLSFDTMNDRYSAMKLMEILKEDI